ncbi:NCA2-domain-containing protein [Daedaleopsis nitida]|nr:NCA2-domain-containing protein [Daedaleopsis nitida]
MSTFVSHIVADLAPKALPSPNAPESTRLHSQRAQPHGVHISSVHHKETLRDLFVQLENSDTPQTLRKCITALQDLEYRQQLLSAELADGEEEALRRAVLNKLALGLYGQALTTFLDEAGEAEAELEWWTELGRSRRQVAYYLLQTLPVRAATASRVLLSTLRSHNIPFHLSVLKPSSLRRLFPSTNTLRPNTLALALFPHLQHQPYSIALVNRNTPAFSLSSSPTQTASSAYSAFVQTLAGVGHACSTLATLPVELARGECAYKRTELARIRDERAEVLGMLVELRDRLAAALDPSSGDEGLFALAQFAHYLQAVIDGQEVAPFSLDADVSAGRVLEALSTLANLTLPSHASLHSADIKTGQLLRPPWLVLVWPQLVLLPPLALYAARAAYASRASLEELAKDAVETLKGFWEDWVLEPLRGIVRTVRAGRDDGVIVTKESVRSDLDSLERMTLALAQDKLGYGSPELDALARQVQAGDLTAVMQIYEEDIKSPLKSAVQGTLLRSLFIQVQKAKVDINQALSGIDKLLKSQELTFAFVGVAPALAIVYAVAGYARNVWSGGRGRGRYGGKARRSGVWLTMRRLERLLVAQPEPHHHKPHPVAAVQKSSSAFGSGSASARVSPLTSGLLLLSVTHLRKYAETTLPANSRLREGFLEDVTDLEDPRLGRAEKLRVIERMWRSWGEPLGWRRIGA